MIYTRVAFVIGEICQYKFGNYWMGIYVLFSLTRKVYASPH
jgi:hypothetical protein